VRGWETKALGEVANFGRGLTYSKADEVSHSRNGVLRANNIDLATKSLDLADIRYIADSVEIPHSKKVRKGSLLICTASGSRSHLGKVALIDADYDLAFGGFMGLITVRPDVDGRFLYYLLTSERFQEKLDSLATGTNINNLKFKDIADFPIPLPPLEEQRRIVAVLDEAFAAIATATANAEKNLVSARDLPSAALTQFGLAGGNAELHRLGDLVTRLTNGYVGPTRNIYVDEGVPYLLARHVRDDVLTFDGRTHISPEFNAANKKSILVTGDVLLVQSGHIGHSAVVPPEHAGHNCHAMIVITPKPRLLGEYLSAYFNSIQGRDATTRIRSGSTVPHLTCREVRELMIPVPSLEAQGALLEKYKAVQFSSKALADVYMRKLAALSELKQSLLHRAFSGELTEREALAA